MLEINAGTLLLIPVSLAVAFLLWVLWNMWRDERRRPSHAERPIDSRTSRKSEKPHVEVGRLSLHR
jgi:threonine/homoserine/homoserine lactone efflux protein